MGTIANKDPDVELKDMGIVEARFLSVKAREWARGHHISNELEAYYNNTQSKSNPQEDLEEAYCHHFGKPEVEKLINKIESSGLTVRRDTRLSNCEDLRWINTY